MAKTTKSKTARGANSRNRKPTRQSMLPASDRSAEHRFHRFLDLWNAHIREQINVHQKILQGKQSLKQHVAQTRKIHQKFLKQLGKI
ncbi:hypothetical protein HYV43_03610 [Candidatus Micrarchaeota archaeon]|nr:hypothetical protein [Candidatus Micrarchaeota archaeon]